MRSCPICLACLLQADDVNRGVETLAGEAQRAVESLQEHAQQAERELRAMENQVGDLLSEIDTIQSRADVLRRMIGEMEEPRQSLAAGN